MSLIHDALRRAQAQRPGGASGAQPEPSWQPVPPPPPRPRPWGWVLLGMVAAFGIVLIWEGWRGERSEPGPPRPDGTGETDGGRFAPTTAASPSPGDRGSGAVSRPTGAGGVEVSGAIPDSGGTGPGGAERPVSVELAGSELAAPTNVGTGAAAVSLPEAVSVRDLPGTSAIPALRLQGILYHPQRPLAVINQRTVGPGSELAGWRVERIEPERVILVGHGRTNVLELP